MVHEQVLLDLLEVGIIVTDADLTVHEWNRFLQLHTQLPRDYVIGKRLDQLFPQIESDILKRKIRTTLQLNQATFYRPIAVPFCIPVPIKRFIQHDLHYMVQRISISPYNAEKGRVLMSIYDETDSKIAQMQLEKEMQTVKQLNVEITQNHSIIDKNLMMLKTDTSGTIIEVSSAMAGFYGYDREDLIGKKPSIFGQKAMPSIFFKEMWEMVRKGQTWHGEIKNNTLKGEEHWVDIVVLPFFDAKGTITQYVAIYHDISDKKRLESLSITDPLTKLFNRNFFDQQMQSIFSGKRRKKPLSMMVIDIDHFKKVNDSFGHRTGDLVLKQFADVLRGTLRSSDVCIRMGGEEFAVLLPGAELVEACGAAEHIRKQIANSHFEKIGTITCSIGVAERSDNDTPERFYERTDMLLYAAKTQGRNRIVHDAIQSS